MGATGVVRRGRTGLLKSGNMRIGKYKAIFDREMNYLSKLNFIMILYIFIEKVTWHWWYLLLIPAYIVWVYIDLRFIMPDEFDYLHGKSPFLKQMQRSIDDKMRNKYKQNEEHS